MDDTHNRASIWNRMIQAENERDNLTFRVRELEEAVNELAALIGPSLAMPIIERVRAKHAK